MEVVEVEDPIVHMQPLKLSDSEESDAQMESLPASKGSTGKAHANGLFEPTTDQVKSNVPETISKSNESLENSVITLESTSTSLSKDSLQPTIEVREGNNAQIAISEETQNAEIPPMSTDQVATTTDQVVTSTETLCKPSDIDSNEINISKELNDADVEQKESDKIIETISFNTEITIEEATVLSCDSTRDALEADTSSMDDHDVTNKILSQFEGENIDLANNLRSTVTETSENNNSFSKDEVLNKEELLDILEGNNLQDTKCEVDGYEGKQDNQQELESEMAIQQLIRVKRRKRKCKEEDKVSIKKIHTVKNKKSKVLGMTESILQDTTKKENSISQETPKKEHTILQETSKKEHTILQETSKKDHTILQETPKKENIVTVLVKDWEDDDVVKSDKLVDESKQLLSDAEKVIKDQEDLNKERGSLDRSSVDSSVSDGCRSQSPKFNKSADDLQPQRRFGRVIKKKVIFDPDNPDTFTTPKGSNKLKTQNEKDHSPKKSKSENTHQRSKSKSPTIKTHWKKPQPKNSRQKRKLTEVDKLLMDEGAVNMIYQLTPEASKGKKNMKTKAELIKKINQSSTPESKEMKFRERRKESKKIDEPEAKKILNVQRIPLNSSVKSPPLCDDYEGHSADDSIIYRRHSSSSYSSSCLSPRRLSDVETSSVVKGNRVDIPNSPCNLLPENGDNISDIFMSSVTETNEIIGKKDCLSLKERLNSKLSRVLNFNKKRESNKTEKIKHPKTSLNSVTDEEIPVQPNFDKLSLLIKNNVAEIIVHTSESGGKCYDCETLKSLSQALDYVNKRTDISVTLLTSECGNLCSGLNMKPLLSLKSEQKKKYATELANSVRSVLINLEQHTKLLATGVAGACDGLALAMLVLCDVAVASDRATFAVQPGRSAPIMPGIAILTAHTCALQASLVQEMVVFGKQLSASEALQRGLVSRTLWPDRFKDELHAIVLDIAAQPLETLLLKKKLLKLKKSVETKSIFVKCLDAERDLLITYWTSTEGQEALKKNLEPV